MDEFRSPSVVVALREEYGWRRLTVGHLVLWLKGPLSSEIATDWAGRLPARPAPVLADLVTALAELPGHFALIVEAPDWACAAVDRSRTIPLFFASTGNTWVIDAQARRLTENAGIGADQLDLDGALALAMSGYTIGAATLYRSLHQLRAGECVRFTANAPQRARYHLYAPWRTIESSPEFLRQRLGEVTLDILARMLASAGERTIAVPLSAGLDSRLVAAGLRHLGARNVCCFAYGRADNFEAEVSRCIAQRLGYPWIFVPRSIAGQRRHFASQAYRDYLAFADSCASTPFEQDLPTLAHLLDIGWLPADAIVVNGNSGDFISGGHVPGAFQNPTPGKDAPEARLDRVLDALLTKHFSLWESLKTPQHLARIRRMLIAELLDAGAPLDGSAADHGLYEYAEFIDRQTKYVTTGQRIYEFLGLDWRLPLWDDAYLNFWEGVPVGLKASQGLYRAMLMNENWGGVWGDDIPINRKTIRPHWIRPLRFLSKVAHAPLGRERWHRFERSVFEYWMNLGCNSAIVPYHKVLRDRRGSRHGLSWHTEAYLHAKGLAYDGTVDVQRH